jgi:transcription termination factor Rho
VYPAVDIRQSGTRKEELLLSPAELAVNRALRQSLSTRESHQATEILLEGLRKTQTNAEFMAGLSRR